MRQRLYYLDLIRLFATLFIFIIHFNAEISMVDTYFQTSNYIFCVNIFGIYLGNLGSSMFFIVSGASLYYVYQERMKISDYYFKRFTNIYPMFWIAWISAFAYNFLANKSIPLDVPKSNYIFTALGLDGYFLAQGKFVPNLYLLGEWFLGCIILIYVVFPIILWAFKKSPILTLIGAVVIYILLIQKLPMVTFPLRLVEVVLGIILVKYIKEAKWYLAAISSGVIFLMSILKPTFISELGKSIIIAFSACVILSFLAKFLKYDFIRKPTQWVCKYSYAIFLTHHFLIYKLVKGFNLAALTRKETYLMFLIYVVATIAASVVLYKVNTIVVKFIVTIKNNIISYFSNKKPVKTNFL